MKQENQEQGECLRPNCPVRMTYNRGRGNLVFGRKLNIYLYISYFKVPVQEGILDLEMLHDPAKVSG